MKKINSQFCKVLLSGILLCAVAAPGNRILAQDNASPSSTSQNTIKGRVLDEKDAPVSYCVIGLKGTTTGATADDNGYFTLVLPAGTTSGDLEVSSLGYTTKVVHFDNTGSIEITLSSGAKNLNEAVVIGYGTAKTKDLTGAITVVGEKDFNEGVISSPEQLIQGKAAGVVVTPNSGAPGAGASINIRGISSITGDTQPLIVLDGVPLFDNSIAGAPSVLSTINPDDIESFTILKDAASTAIYGNRGSNGVIIITTKHGKTGKLSVDISSTTSLQQITKYTDVMGASQFRSFIEANGDAAQIALLGNSNTNWQKQIYQNALSTNNAISISGGVKDLPYRLSFGNFDQDGILKTGYLKRQSVGLNLSPSFLNNTLKVTVNVNATHSENRFANGAAIGDAIRFDPTQPIYSGNKNFGGYYAWLVTGGDPNSLSTSNPVADLNDKRDISGVNRVIGNVQVEYAIPSISGLRAVVNGGEDISGGNGYTSVLPSFAGSYAAGGTYDTYKQYLRNDLLDMYLNYRKDIKSIRSVIDVTAGYGYQDYIIDNPATTTYYIPSTSGVITPPTVGTPDSEKQVLLSYYARLSYTFNNKYILNLSDREDYSSQVASPHSGNFPGASAAWKINEENFLKNSKALSALKLRVSYGETGNSNIGNYHYIPNYAYYQTTAQYQLGNTYYTPLAPAAYNTNLKWETMKGTNLAMDYGFLNNRITGSLDFYQRNTSGLLLYAPVAALANLSNEITQNIGSLTNKGVEFSISAVAVTTKDINWTVNFNIAYNENKVTALYGPGSIVQTGGISGGTGNTVQGNVVGQPVNAFYVYQQVYNANGTPVEGLYETQKNGSLFYSYKSPNPTTTLGFSTNFSYKKWNLFAAMHADVGNYVYNNVLSNLDTKNAFLNSLGFLANGSPDVLNTKFANSQYFSDYYVQNASFLRMDNIALSYNFGKIIARKIGLTVSVICQNVFVITKYTGLNPEIPNGIDNNVYPIPRVYSLGIKLNF